MKTINEVIEFLREQENSLKASENSMQELKEFKEKQAAKNAKLKKDILSALDAFMSEDEVTAPVAEEKPVEVKETVSTPTMQEVIAAKAAEAAEKAEAKKAADKLAADIAEAKELAEKAKAEQKARAEELKARSAKALAEQEAKARAKAEQEDAEQAARAKEAQEAIAKATKAAKEWEDAKSAEQKAKEAEAKAERDRKMREEVEAIRVKHEEKHKVQSTAPVDGMTPERLEKLTALYDETNPEYMQQAVVELKKEGEALTPYINENGWFTRSLEDCTKIEKRTAEIVSPLIKELTERGITMDDLKYQHKLTFSKVRAKQMINYTHMYGMLPRSIEGVEPSEQKQHINQLIRQLMLNRLLNSEQMDEWRSENGYASVAQIPDADLAKAYTSLTNKFMFDALYEETL